jgi:hypothetical protein
MSLALNAARHRLIAAESRRQLPCECVLHLIKLHADLPWMLVADVLAIRDAGGRPHLGIFGVIPRTEAHQGTATGRCGG